MGYVLTIYFKNKDVFLEPYEKEKTAISAVKKALNSPEVERAELHEMTEDGEKPITIYHH